MKTEIGESHGDGQVPVSEIAAGDWVSRVLSWLLKGKVIMNCERRPYLFRWYVVRTPWLGFFVHRFVRSDEDRALHDHPWAFVVIPVWRGYLEHNVAGVRRVRPLLGIRFRSATYRHRVELIAGKPAWSLFLRFRYVRVWGFWPAGGFVDWKQWWSDLCED